MGSCASVDAQATKVPHCFKCQHKIKALFDQKTCETCGIHFHKGYIKVLGEVKPEVKNKVTRYKNQVILHVKSSYTGFEDHLHYETCYHQKYLTDYFLWYEKYEQTINLKNKTRKDNLLRRSQTLPSITSHGSQIHPITIMVAPKMCRNPDDDDYIH